MDISVFPQTLFGDDLPGAQLVEQLLMRPGAVTTTGWLTTLAMNQSAERPQ